MIEYENKIVLGDCLEILPQLPNKIFDLIIIDLPYNLKKDFQNDNFSSFDFKKLLKKWMKEIILKLKENGSIYIFMGHDYKEYLRRMLSKHLIFKRELIWWYKDYGIKWGKGNYLSEFDSILFFVKSDNYIFNSIKREPSKSTLKRWSKYADTDGFIDWKYLPPYHKIKYKTEENYNKNGKWNINVGKRMGNVFCIPRVSRGNNPEKKFGNHPTQKPEALIENFIKVSSNENDLIGDFFMGSGTTCVVAKKLRRKYFGCEIESKYCEIAKKRLNDINVYQNITKFFK